MSIGTRLLPLAALLVLLVSGCGVPAPEAPQADPEVQLLLIGIDGASWEEMMPLVQAGKMPHIEALMRDGYSARLTTMAPALSPVIWTTIATGKAPSKHGIRGFITRDPDADQRLPVTSNMRRTSAIWNMLGDAGVPVGVVGWWVTWPAEQVNGWMVSPYTAPGQTTWKGTVYATGRSGQTWPEDYMEKIRSEIEAGEAAAPEEFSALFPVPENMDLPEYLRAFLADTKWVHISDRIFRGVGSKILREEQPRFMAVYFGGVDVTGHRFWRFAHPGEGEWERTDEQIAAFSASLDRYYQWADEAVGQLVAAAPAGTNFMVVSDHGMELRTKIKRRRSPQNLFPEAISGGHTSGPSGILVFSGAAAAHNFQSDLWSGGGKLPSVGSASHPGVVDLTPSILHLFGLPVGRDMDGIVLDELFAGGASRAVAFVDTWDDPDRVQADPTAIESPRMDEVLKRLEGLGYINNDD